MKKEKVLSTMQLIGNELARDIGLEHELIITYFGFMELVEKLPETHMFFNQVSERFFYQMENGIREKILLEMEE